MNALNIISFLALLFSITGNTLVNFRKKSGFVWWIASNVLWIAVNFIGPTNWSQVALFVIYAALNVHGYIQWSSK